MDEGKERNEWRGFCNWEEKLKQGGRRGREKRKEDMNENQRKGGSEKGRMAVDIFLYFLSS